MITLDIAGTLAVSRFVNNTDEDNVDEVLHSKHEGHTTLDDLITDIEKYVSERLGIEQDQCNLTGMIAYRKGFIARGGASVGCHHWKVYVHHTS